jgi:hypothetical protein
MSNEIRVLDCPLCAMSGTPDHLSFWTGNQHFLKAKPSALDHLKTVKQNAVLTTHEFEPRRQTL